MKQLIYFSMLLLAFACGKSAVTETTIEAKPNEFLREVEDWNPQKDSKALDDFIRVTSPEANAAISSPFTITGEAMSGFFFEGEFPVSLRDADDKVLSTHFGTAKGDWMKPGFVDFTAEIKFDAPAGTKAWLKLENNNPSDGEGFRRGIIIPVILQ